MAPSGQLAGRRQSELSLIASSAAAVSAPLALPRLPRLGHLAWAGLITLILLSLALLYYWRSPGVILKEDLGLGPGIGEVGAVKLENSTWIRTYLSLTSKRSRRSYFFVNRSGEVKFHYLLSGGEITLLHARRLNPERPSYFDPLVRTRRGLSLGDPLTKALRLYGPPSQVMELPRSGTMLIYLYRHGLRMSLVFNREGKLYEIMLSKAPAALR